MTGKVREFCYRKPVGTQCYAIFHFRILVVIFEFCYNLSKMCQGAYPVFVVGLTPRNLKNQKFDKFSSHLI